MTIGEKIKYCRKQLGITQNTLAELTGIHPVSIRKYETNKMEPQGPQLEKLAEALGISSNALKGNNNAGLKLETYGDLMGILMVLCNSGIIEITGERGEDKLLLPETVSIKFSPILDSFIEFIAPDNSMASSVKDTIINIKDKIIFSDLLKWEKMNYMYKTALDSMGENPNSATKEAMEEISETKEKVELQLQKRHLMLDSDDGLNVKIPQFPGYYE